MGTAEAAVSSRAVRPVVAGLVASGHDPALVLARVGVEPKQIADPDARIPHRVAIDLWNAAVQTTGDEAFGLRVAAALDIGSSFDVFGYVFLSSETVGAGLERISRYHRLNHDVAIIELVEDRDPVCFRHRLSDPLVLPRATAEFIVASWTQAIREATGLAWTPTEVHFTHREPADVTFHREFFGVMPVFGAGENGIVFPRSFLSTPHLAANSALSRVLERYAQDLLAKIPAIESFADRVRGLLAAQLRGGNPSAETVADALHMSVRTLSRRLADEGTSVKEQLEDLRSHLAIRYLSDEGVSIADIAFLLGFSESSAFHRAFKRWTGKTPSQYRNR